MSFKSVLDKIGAGFEDVFTFIGSAKGQAVIATGEGLVESFAPGAAGFIQLLNAWGTEVIKTQALATAAGKASGSGAQQAAAVLAAITPQALAFAKAQGIANPSDAQLQAANNALVAFANAFSGEPEAATATTTTATSA